MARDPATASGSTDSQPAAAIAGDRLDPFDPLDPIASSDYVARFESEMATLEPRRIATRAWRSAWHASQLLLLGEYHPLDSALRTARRMIEAARPGGTWLGLEMIHARDQRALDDYLAGHCSAASLRRRMRYRSEWGYPWPAAERLLRTAARRGAPAYGLDMPPRGGVSDLTLRDEAAADRIVARHARHRTARAVVVFGEAHLAAPHLLDQLRSRLGRRARIVRVLHDLPHPGATTPGIYAAGDDLFLVQRHHPAARAAALHRIYAQWARAAVPADDALDWDLLFRELVQLASRAFGVDPRREPVSGGSRLVDWIPEVIPWSNRTLRRLACERTTPARTGALSPPIERPVSDWSWSPETGAVFVVRPGIRVAALEAARFVLSFRRGELPRRSPLREPEARIAEHALAAALVARSDAGLRRLGVRAVLPSGVAIQEVRRSLGRLRELFATGEQRNGRGFDGERLAAPVGLALGIELARQLARGELPWSRFVAWSGRSLSERTTARRLLIELCESAGTRG